MMFCSASSSIFCAISGSVGDDFEDILGLFDCYYRNSNVWVKLSRFTLELRASSADPILAVSISRGPVKVGLYSKAGVIPSCSRLLSSRLPGCPCHWIRAASNSTAWFTGLNDRTERCNIYKSILAAYASQLWLHHQKSKQMNHTLTSAPTLVPSKHLHRKHRSGSTVAYYGPMLLIMKRRSAVSSEQMSWIRTASWPFGASPLLLDPTTTNHGKPLEPENEQSI